MNPAPRRRRECTKRQLKTEEAPSPHLSFPWMDYFTKRLHFIKHMATALSSKWDKVYSITSSYIRSRLAFAGVRARVEVLIGEKERLGTRGANAHLSDGDQLVMLDVLEIDQFKMPTSPMGIDWRRLMCWRLICLRNLHPFVPSSQQTAEDQSECLACSMALLQFIKLGTIITKMNSIKQMKKAIFLVRVDWEEQVHVLWCTEIERYGLGTRDIGRVRERNGLLSDALLFAKAYELANELNITLALMISSSPATTPPSVTICSNSLRPQAATPPNSAAIAAAIKLDSATPIASTSPNLSPQTQGECDETPDGKLVLSNGWLARWKGRHGVFGVRLHGVAEEDVFNVDETGLFIDKHLVWYYNNKNAWMNSDVFSDWTWQVNAEFKRQKRLCQMILDNATSHAVADVSQTNVGSFIAFKLSNLLPLFLPANCTSVVQPLDQGNIAAFKARYKSKLA
eukprot:Em0009g904a